MPRSDREADATRPVRTVFLRRGATTTLHRHPEEVSFIQVVSGAMVDERWRRDRGGHLLHERRVLRRDQSLAAPSDALHRVRALDDTAFVTSCEHGCADAWSATDDEVAAAREARAGADRGAVVTAVGVPAPPGRGPRRVVRRSVVRGRG